MFANSRGLTYQCCFLTHDPIGVAPGNNMLYVRHDVITTCMFGYNESTGCEQCLQGHRGTFSFENLEYEFNLNFNGPFCSQMTGMLRDISVKISYPVADLHRHILEALTPFLPNFLHLHVVFEKI